MAATADAISGGRLILGLGAGWYDHQVRDAVLLPPPDRPIPILVAADRRRMLGLTARYADAWNTAWFGLPDDRLRQRLTDLDAALEAEGRDPATLRRTIGMAVRDPASASPDEGGGVAFGGSVDELAQAIDAHEALGFNDLIVGLESRTELSLDRLPDPVPWLGWARASP